jgi:hypothetical protein
VWWHNLACENFQENFHRLQQIHEIADRDENFNDHLKELDGVFNYFIEWAQGQTDKDKFANAGINKFQKTLADVWGAYNKTPRGDVDGQWRKGIKDFYEMWVGLTARVEKDETKSR